jgi:hypothetical protein
MIQYKDEEIERRAEMLNPALISIMIEMASFCASRDQVLVVTETVTTHVEDEKLGRRSASHREARAIDIRTRDWPQEFTQDFIEYFELRHGEKGAIPFGYADPKLIVDKSNTESPHLHVQLNRTYAKQPAWRH